MADVSFRTDVFEGPLDLLLHLISKNKVNIYDIPISEITDQYFDYLSQCEALDMEISSEFAVMAAQLLWIKSKLLLPVYEDEEDPRTELVDRLEEYKRYKEISQELDVMQHASDETCFKSPEKLDIPKVVFENKQMNPQILYTSFLLVLERNLAAKPLSMQNFSGIIGKKMVSIPEQSQIIMKKLKSCKRLPFESIFDNMTTKGEMVATFVAILELIRDNHITVDEEDGRLICRGCDDFDGYSDSSTGD